MIIPGRIIILNENGTVVQVQTIQLNQDPHEAGENALRQFPPNYTYKVIKEEHGSQPS